MLTSVVGSQALVVIQPHLPCAAHSEDRDGEEDRQQGRGTETDRKDCANLTTNFSRQQTYLPLPEGLAWIKETYRQLCGVNVKFHFLLRQIQ